MSHTLPENPYLLLTPGPLSTSQTVKAAMLRDWCTWDRDYNDLVQEIRANLLKLATDSDAFTTVLKQGSGTFAVESALGTLIPRDAEALILENGAYGKRMVQMAKTLNIRHQVLSCSETEAPTPEALDQLLTKNPQIKYVAVVHCETTTGILNPVEKLGEIAKKHHCIFIVDAMSSFGGIPMSMESLHADVLISSANKCIQGVPGFGFIIARKALIEAAQGNARSLALDLHDQWQQMEDGHGKWRFTSPTHTVRAFHQALHELAEEGGVSARFDRYTTNQSTLVEGMAQLGFKALIERNQQSPFITSFLNPTHPNYTFEQFYNRLKGLGFVIYPGKVSAADCFRIGNIGEVYPQDIRALLEAIETSCYWNH